MTPNKRVIRFNQQRDAEKQIFSQQRILVLAPYHPTYPVTVPLLDNDHQGTIQSFCDWVNTPNNNRCFDSLNQIFEHRPVARIINVNQNEIKFNSSNILYGFLIAQKLFATDHLRFAHPRSLIQSIEDHNEDGAVNLIRQHYDMIILCDDSEWEVDSWLCTSTAQTNQTVLGFTSRFVEQARGKCFPPLSRVRATLNKPIRDHILRKHMLPHHTLQIGTNFSNWLRLRHLRDSLQHAVEQKYSLDNTTLNFVIDSSKLILKKGIGNSSREVYVISESSSDGQWVVSSVGYATYDNVQVDWNSLTKSVVRVEPFMKQLASEEHHFFVAKSGGIVGQPQLHILYNTMNCFREYGGRHMPIAFCRQGFTRSFVMVLNQEPFTIPNQPVVTFLRNVLCDFQNCDPLSPWDIDSLCFRVDLGLIRDCTGKVKDMYVNEIGLVPTENLFIRSVEELPCLHLLAEKTATYISSHFFSWPA